MNRIGKAYKSSLKGVGSPEHSAVFFKRSLNNNNNTFGSTFFCNVSVVVLLTAANVLSTATPAVSSAPAANTTSPDVGSDARPQFEDGTYKINFAVNNVLRSVLGNSHDVVTALSPNVIPIPFWDIKQNEHGFFSLSVSGKSAGEATTDRTIPLGKDSGPWAITKPFNRPAGPNEWIILSPAQIAIFPPPESGWKLADGTATGPLTIENEATIFTFVRVGN